MKKENEIYNTETSPTEIDSTDLGTFLGKIARYLTKEGNSLQALADKWFDAGENRNIARQFGIDIGNLGRSTINDTEPNLPKLPTETGKHFYEF